MIGAFEQMSKARTVRWPLRSPSERIATMDHGIDKEGAQLPEIAIAWELTHVS